MLACLEVALPAPGPARPDAPAAAPVARPRDGAAGRRRGRGRSASCPDRREPGRPGAGFAEFPGATAARRFAKVRRRSRPRSTRNRPAPGARPIRRRTRPVMEEQGAWRLTTFARRPIALARPPGLVAGAPAGPGRGLAPDDQLRRRGPDRRGRPAGRRARRGLPGLDRQGLARPRAARLVRPLPDPGQADPGRGRRPDLVRVQPGQVPDQDDDRRGAARPHPRLGAAARGHPHRLRRLLRRPDAPMGRRGGLAPQRGPPRAPPPRPDRPRPARPPRQPAARPALHGRGLPRAT